MWKGPYGARKISWNKSPASRLKRRCNILDVDSFASWFLALYRYSWKVKSTSRAGKDLPEEPRVEGAETKSARRRRINIQNIRKQGRFAILFVKIVELFRSSCYERSHVLPLLQNAPRDGGAVTCYRAQRRRTREKYTDTVVLRRPQNMRNELRLTTLIAVRFPLTLSSHVRTILSFHSLLYISSLFSGGREGVRIGPVQPSCFVRTKF